MKVSNRNILKSILRLLLSIGLLFVICQTVDLNLFYGYVRQVNMVWILCALLLLLVVRLVVAIKWQIILEHHGIDIPMKELVYVVFISMTLGQILPAGVGSDVVRGYKLSKKYGKAQGTTATIIIDRAVGMYSLFFMALLGSIVAELMGMSTGLVWGLLVLNIMIAVALVNVHRLQSLLNLILPKKSERFQKINGHVQSIVKIISDTSTLRQILPSIFSWSMVIQLVRCGVFFFLFLAFGQNLQMLYFIAFIPLVFVVTLLPVSIGGLGVREGILAVLFSSVGVPTEICVGVGLFSQIVQIIAAVPVLGVWLFEK